MSGDLVAIDNRPPALGYDMMAVAMTAQSVVAQVTLIQSVMKSVMKDKEHFGVIPGCGNKPALLKAGAEKLMMTFHLAPEFKITAREMPGGHREYEVICNVMAPNGQFLGAGVGYCSSMESKYRWRNAQRKCPQCGKETIIKGKAEYGGGWVCFKNKGGCGAKWNDGAPEIENQEMGKIENPDITDVFNTVLKMAKKRALVDATLTVTAASDIFTQDIEDLPGVQDKPPQTAQEPRDNAPPAQGRQPAQTSSRGSARGQGEGTPRQTRGRQAAAPQQQAQPPAREPMNQMDEPWADDAPPPPEDDRSMSDPNPWPPEQQANNQGGFVPATKDQIGYIRDRITSLGLEETWAKELQIAAPGADGQSLSRNQATKFADHLDMMEARRQQGGQ